MKKEDITKSMFEDMSYMFLKRNSPAIIMIEGEDYREFVSKFQKPFDPLFTDTMQQTLKYMCENIPCCIFGYTKEFEVTILLLPPKDISEKTWFGRDVQKITSMAASMATVKFNKYFEKTAKSYVMAGNNFDETRKLSAMQGYVNAIDKGAFFTAKCFNIALNDIPEYIYKQQKESIHTGVQLMGRTYFSEEELRGKTQADIQFMVFDKAGINFDSYLPENKRGSACVRSHRAEEMLEHMGIEDELWEINKDVPVLKPENREFINLILGITK